MLLSTRLAPLLRRFVGLQRTHVGVLSQSYSTTGSRRSLEGRTAVITGGVSGIGEATAHLLVECGANVVIADVQDAAGYSLVEELGGPSRARFVHCDVTIEKDVAAALDTAMEKFGRLDIVHSNAGFVGAVGPLESLNMDDFNRTVAVHLQGAVHCVKHAARIMKPQKSGSIVLTSSTASVCGGMGPHGYTVAKTALLGVLRSAAVELRQFHIRVNAVSPHAVHTPMMQQAIGSLTGKVTEPVGYKDAEHIFLSGQGGIGSPGSILRPGMVANAVVFLASDDSDYISGHNLLIDASVTVGQGVKGNSWFEGDSNFLGPTDKIVFANVPNVLVQ